MKTLTNKERLIRQARGHEVDQIPTIGGWILGVTNLSRIAKIGTKEFLINPLKGTIAAYKILGVDGMVNPVIPTSLDQIRTGLVQEEKFKGTQPEALLEAADQIPDVESKVLASFNYGLEENRYRNYFNSAYSNWEGIEPIPNFWEIGGHFPLYTEYGYTAFLMACAIYPEAVGKIYWAKSLHSRERAKILLKLYKEYDLVPIMFCGEDVCNNKGPMVSPEFLRKHYFPSVKMIVEPLVDAGIRLVHHCDGDIRPVVQDFINIGFSGFQGFQYELGISLHEMKDLRSPMGEDFIFFTGLSVSRTLPFGDAKDIRDEVDYFLDFSDGGKGIFLFTSNVTGVEVAPQNIVEAYHYIKKWNPKQRRKAKWLEWPWKTNHAQ